MPKVWNVQSDFSGGEIDPKLVGRIDLAVYYNSLKQARDVTPLVQGGLQRRFGTRWVGETDTQAYRSFDFKFSTEEQYLLTFAANRIYVYKDGTELQTNINGSGNDYIDTGVQYTAAQLVDIDIFQTADTVIILHPDVAPARLIRLSDTAWTFASLPLTNLPQFDYDDGDSPSPTSEVQTITFANQNTSDRYKLGLNGILTEEIIFSSDQTTNAENIRIALQDLPNTANSGITVTSSAITTYQITFAAASADDWDLLTGTAIQTQNVAFAVTAVEDTQGVPRSEDVWSATRGWPVSGTFHEGRLWFGGSKSRIQTIWGSVVNDFFNFNKGRGRDDEGITATLDTDQVNAIQRIFSNRALQVFTTGQEFYIPNSPVTPENIAVIPQTNFGAALVRPITIDGRTLYFQRTGKAIREFLQSSDVTNIYNSQSITLLAPHLVNTPTRMAATRGDDQTDANYAYFVNTDGTLLIYNSLGSEEVSGFTLWTIDGFSFIDVGVINDDLFALVQSGTTTHVVQLNSDYFTDLSVLKTTPVSGTFTGLDHLEGLTVQIIGDGAFEGTAVVSSGQVTVDGTKAITEVGLAYNPLIETMPLNIPLQNGPNFSEPKKINRVTVDFENSLGIIIKNSLGYTARVADKTMAVDVFDDPTPKSGREDLWLMGWDKVATVTITQDTPMAMTILTIGVEVGVQ